MRVLLLYILVLLYL